MKKLSYVITAVVMIIIIGLVVIIPLGVSWIIEINVDADVFYTFYEIEKTETIPIVAKWWVGVLTMFLIAIVILLIGVILYGAFQLSININERVLKYIKVFMSRVYYKIIDP